MTNRDKLLKKNKLEGLEIDKEITKDHPFNDELALHRKAITALINGEPIPQEFLDYCAEAERKKAEVKERLK